MKLESCPHSLKRVIVVLVISICSALQGYCCSMCNCAGMIEQRKSCPTCDGRGKTVEKNERLCHACSGSGRQSSAGNSSSGYYRGMSVSGAKGTFCRNCNGAGKIKSGGLVVCTSCGGKGSWVKWIVCPACKGSSRPGGKPSSGAMSSADLSQQAVNTVAVTRCDKCDKNGNVRNTVVCEMCEKGFNHLKKDVDGKVEYVCRKCKKVCSSRFSKCACAEGDCPHCNGTGMTKQEDIPCPFCFGDKIITPWERAKQNAAQSKTDIAK